MGRYKRKGTCMRQSDDDDDNDEDRDGDADVDDYENTLRRWWWWWEIIDIIVRKQVCLCVSHIIFHVSFHFSLRQSFSYYKQICHFSICAPLHHRRPNFYASVFNGLPCCWWCNMCAQIAFTIDTYFVYDICSRSFFTLAPFGSR